MAPLAWVGLGTALVLYGSAAPARHLPSDAFVWQLAWPPAVGRAVAEGTGVFATWHVLVAEVAASGQSALVRPDWTALLARGHSVIPVVRIEGRIDERRRGPLVDQVRGLLAGLPPSLRSVEIDHDAATAGLAVYAMFLRALRVALPPDTPIGITVLPTWIASPGFPALAEAADRLILQVHAVDDPRLGLFGADRALGFVRALAGRTRTPFQVALPAYGVRVASTGAGLAVSAEMPASDGARGQEIAADPAEVARFVAEIERDPPDRLSGLVWFRLPVAGDARAWGMATLRDVAAGRQPDGRALALTRRGRVAGASDILVVNAGTDDVVLPRHITLPQDCVAADGLGQYVLEPGRLSLLGAGLLGGRTSVLAGWMRCAGDVHAEK